MQSTSVQFRNPAAVTFQSKKNFLHIFTQPTSETIRQNFSKTPTTYDIQRAKAANIIHHFLIEKPASLIASLVNKFLSKKSSNHAVLDYATMVLPQKISQTSKN